MIDQILVDLDDVLNQFTMHALRYMGCLNCDTDADFPIEVGYNIVAACNLKHPTQHWTPKQFWSNLSREVWVSTPESEWMMWLLNWCGEAVGRKNVLLATSPTYDPECAAGKTQWIQEHMPDWMLRQYSITPKKEAYAHPKTLLIDDAEINVDTFRAKHGQAILVPKPWNRNNRLDPQSHVEFWLKDALCMV